jgi:hypothetical protein
VPLSRLKIEAGYCDQIAFYKRTPEEKEAIMKQLKFFYVLAFAGLFMAGCATRAYVERDESVNFSKYQTYAWVDTQEDINDTVRTKVSDLTERQIRQAVNTELTKAGWKEVNNRPELLLTYDVLVEKSSKENSSPVYSRPQTRWYYNPYTRRWQSVYYPSQLLGYDVEEKQVREGTITVTIIDARTDKTIWQGWTTDEVNSRNLSGKEIQNSVKNIFRKFDIAKR